MEHDSTVTFNELSALVESDSQPRKILRPFNNLRNIYNPRTILVIASEGCLNIPDDLKTFTESDNPVNVHFTSKLPLANHDKHPSIDAIVLVYQVFNKNSLKTITDSIPYIDIRYFVGKCFILIISDTEFQQTDVYDIETLAGCYQLPVHYVSKVVNPDGTGTCCLQVPSGLMSVYCPPIGSDVNSLIINAAIMRGSSLHKSGSGTQQSSAEK